MKNIISALTLLIGFSFAHGQLKPGPGNPGYPPQPPQISPAQQQAEEQRRQASLVVVRQEIHAVGIDSNDCMQTVSRRAEQQTFAAITECERQTAPYFRCEIGQSRVTDYGSMITGISGSGFYDQKKSNEETCRQSATSSAESNAIARCQDFYGTLCQVTYLGAVSHDQHKIRRYVIFGPWEYYDRCSASATAEPVAQNNVQCSVVIEAHPRGENFPHHH